MNRWKRVAALLVASSALIGWPVAAQPAPGPVASFPTGTPAPAGAPNILIIMTDDVGFGASSTFGGAIPTPTFDALAASGVRYAEFHTTAVCSATRAALLTGRNSHAVGAGSIPEMATPEPGYNSVLPDSAATFAKVFQRNGYSTAMLGKHHNTPVWEDVPGGPNAHKPNMLGFDYFYGFHGAATNEYYPSLYENLNRVRPPDQPGYILDRDLADHALTWLRNQRTYSPNKPFLLYYAPGTLHAPVQAPAEWIARFKGKFDQGWDVLRRQIFERQKRLGVIPKNAGLAPMPPGTLAWDTLSPGQKRLAARYMEVYAGALAYCDDQIGRIIADLKASGQYDNTLIIFLQGDNGASVEGGPDGAFSYSNRLNNVPEKLEDNLARIDELGGPKSLPAIPAGWARATNAPFPWNKTIASHLGGTRNGMVIEWPGHMTATATVRFQYGHVTDIAPTLYEAAGIAAPETVDGVQQQKLDGVSLLYTLKDPIAPSRHTEQVFEVFGNMGLYKDGWQLASTPVNSGQSIFEKSDAPLKWELYNLDRDYSQVNDLAAKEPGRLQAMLVRFDALAEANHIKPISRDVAARVRGVDRGMTMMRPGRFFFVNSDYSYGALEFPSVNGGRAWSMKASLTVPANGGDGMIVTQGGYFGGWGLAVLGGRPTLFYRFNELEGSLSRLADAQTLAPGKHVIALAFAPDQPRPGTGGMLHMTVDGREAGALRLDKTIPFSLYEESQVGRDYDTTLSSDYRTPFIYPGEIASVEIDTRGRQK
jgi:arylsulfatase